MQQRYIPQNAQTHDFPEAALIAYAYQSGKGASYIAYKGRQSKPIQHFSFSSAERRDRALDALVARETEREAAKLARRQAGHGLSVGDIVYSSWGYEQTNVTFFQVVRLPSDRSATVRQLEDVTTQDDKASMTGFCSPKVGEFNSAAKEQTRRAIGLHRLSGGRSSIGDLQKWHGRPCRVSMYA